MKHLITLEDVYKSYRRGEVDIPVLQGVALEIERGELVALVGTSGSGKSTLSPRSVTSARSLAGRSDQRPIEMICFPRSLTTPSSIGGVQMGRTARARRIIRCPLPGAGACCWKLRCACGLCTYCGVCGFVVRFSWPQGQSLRRDPARHLPRKGPVQAWPIASST